MPIPTPERAEGRDAFIARCMADPQMAEFAEEGQRYAVCARSYTKARIASSRADDAAELGASLKPTEEMAEEARRGLKWRKALGRGGTRIGVARARDISNRRDLSANTVKRMRSFFARHEGNKEAEGFRPGEEGYPSPGRIAWALWGGDAGQAWAEERAPKEKEAAMERVAQLEASYTERPGKRYRMIAYTGQEVDLNGERLVFDLAGVEVGNKAIPILRQHDPENIVGHSLEVSIDDEQIVIDLQVSASTEGGREVLELFGDGFPWQASVGMVMKDIERFGAGEVIEVNGRTLEGPIGVVRCAVLREASFVPLGADAATSVAALAAQLQGEQGEETMTAEEEREVIDKKHEEMLDALRDLIDALPDRLEMAVAAFMEGKTVTEAKAALADTLMAELADKSAKLEAAAKPTAELRAQVAAELAAEQRQPVSATIDAAPAPVLDVRGQWDAALNAELSAGLSRPDAVAKIVRKNPTLHREFIAAANNGLKG